MRGKSNIQKGVASVHIGVDLLGSDIPPNDLLKAVLSFFEELKQPIYLTLFGTSEVFDGNPSPFPQVIFHPVKEVIAMDEPPLIALRRKPDSSLCTGIRLLKEGHLQAFISAGNTGALMGCAKLTLPPLPKVERPALLTLLPTKETDLAVLDVGANTSYKAHHLVQFAAMGVAYQRARGISMPRVGLLNIGSEARKGTPEIQEAYKKLEHTSRKSSCFSFVGNIEARDVFHGKIDVLVTDGFTGNVFLKTAEGIATVILEQLENSILLNECPSSFKGIMGELRQRLHYAEYPGALLCGVDGIVIKCHGNASPQSLSRSITTAARLIEHSFLTHLREDL